MIPRDELSRWLTDPEAQDATADRFPGVSRQIKALPFMERLRKDIDASPHDAASALACARRAMLDEEGLAEVFSRLAGAAAADPYFRPAMRSVASEVHTGLILFDTAELTLFAAVMPAEGLAAKRNSRVGPRSIVFPGQQSLYRFVRSGGATFSFWKAPQIEPGFTAEASGRCRLVERRRIVDGELFEMDGRSESFVVEHAAGDLVYLQATTSAGRAPLTVEYDTDSYTFVGASSTDEVSSRTQMMLSLLRTMERADAVPVMIGMLDNPHFYARWQAMRELLALDAEAALPHLAAMAGADPHPEVSTAAAATLSACFPSAAAMPAPAIALEVN
jgi:HEAT repeats